MNQLFMNLVAHIKKIPLYVVGFWKKNLFHKCVAVLLAALTLFTATSYAIAYWYQQSVKNQPLVFGTTFIANYARYFDLDPKQVLQASIDELGIKRYRLVSYWKEIEKTPGVYDFSDLDWQFDMIEQAGGEVSLAVGLRQPRWPECHMPSWLMKADIDEWYPRLRTFMSAVVERYKDRNVLKSYQLENEFFMSTFGECPDHSRWRLVEEYQLMKELDNTKPVIITRSNNSFGWPVNSPIPDEYGISIYKRVWEGYVTNRYIEYPYPDWMYAFFAGMSKLTQDRNVFVHELQAEAWLPTGMSMKTASTDELYKSMSPEILKKRLNYAVDTGLRTIDLWGMEWWYFMKEKRNSPELWNVAREELQSIRASAD